MDPNVKAEWLAALRSGEWVQGRQQLRGTGFRANEFCCLGVLCEQARQGGATDGWQVSHDTYLYGDQEAAEQDPTEFDGSWSTLPVGVQQWAGLDADDPYVELPGTNGEKRKVSVLNDNGWTFEQIADLIEAQL